jgi:hypothetical protein
MADELIRFVLCVVHAHGHDIRKGGATPGRATTAKVGVAPPLPATQRVTPGAPSVGQNSRFFRANSRDLGLADGLTMGLAEGTA